jgi:nucleoprotein TPR
MKVQTCEQRRRYGRLVLKLTGATDADTAALQSVQGRLVEENKTLALERSHISDLMVNVQKMHNDLERSGENDRRRLENQLQMLEGQTYDSLVQASRH